MLVRLTDCLTRSNSKITIVPISHFFNHLEWSKILEVTAALTVTEVVVKLIWNETASLWFITWYATKHEVDFQLVFSRHFWISCRNDVRYFFICLFWWCSETKRRWRIRTSKKSRWVKLMTCSSVGCKVFRLFGHLRLHISILVCLKLRSCYRFLWTYESPVLQVHFCISVTHIISGHFFNWLAFLLRFLWSNIMLILVSCPMWTWIVWLIDVFIVPGRSNISGVVFLQTSITPWRTQWILSMADVRSYTFANCWPSRVWANALIQIL